MEDITPSINEENFDAILNHDSWYFTREAQVTPAVTGSISAASSILVMSIIMRSQTKLSTAYHRIMFFMCIWDAISSIAIALTTIPMPSDVIYPYQGASYGTAGTCAAQGFMILLGQAFTIFSNCVLNIYYIFTIRYGMAEETAKRRFLPMMLLCSCLLCIPAAGIPLWLGLINPCPVDTSCYIASYPYECRRLGLDCIRGGDVSEATSTKLIIPLASLVCLAFLVVIISMVLVVLSVFKTEKETRNEVAIPEEERNELGLFLHTNEALQEEQSQANIQAYDEFIETRTTLRLALMYIAAFIITWIWPIVGVFFAGRRFSNDFSKAIESPAFWYIFYDGKAICLPSQGLFNCIIFIFHKICILRTKSGNEEGQRLIPFLSALKSVIISPSQVPEIIVMNIQVVNNQVTENFATREASVVSPAEISSGFRSVETPSFTYSNALSKGGIDSEKEREFKEKGDPSKKRVYYTNVVENIVDSGTSSPISEKEDHRNESCKNHHL